MVNKKGAVITLAVLVFLASSSFSLAEEPYQDTFLLGVWFKAQALTEKALSEIRKIELEIGRNEETRRKTEQVLALSQQKGNKKAEMIAREALSKVQIARSKNEETKKKWEFSRLHATRSLGTIENHLSHKPAFQAPIKGFITNYRGRVEILKANGEKPSPDQGFLEAGDKVLTLDGSAEIQALDGRAVAKIGPYSEFSMEKDSPQEQVVELLKGKVYLSVEKVDDYVQKLKKKVDQYQTDSQTITQWLQEQGEENIEKMKEGYRRKMMQLQATKYGCKGYDFENKRLKGCIIAVCAVRSTQLTSEVLNNNRILIHVLEGIVDLTLPDFNKTVSLTTGVRAVIDPDGTIHQEKVENAERWWEE